MRVRSPARADRGDRDRYASDGPAAARRARRSAADSDSGIGASNFLFAFGAFAPSAFGGNGSPALVFGRFAPIE
jgi:hypothetical protein